MYLVDFQLRVLVLMRWTWAYFTWKWGVRLITGPLKEMYCPLPESDLDVEEAPIP